MFSIIGVLACPRKYWASDTGVLLAWHSLVLSSTGISDLLVSCVDGPKRDIHVTWTVKANSLVSVNTLVYWLDEYGL